MYTFVFQGQSSLGVELNQKPRLLNGATSRNVESGASSTNIGLESTNSGSNGSNISVSSLINLRGGNKSGRNAKTFQVFQRQNQPTL